jgi:ubiquinone/menaquinone biosynthesis C-methylase UbiE
VTPRSDNPQLWDDPLLFDLFLRPQWEYLIKSVTAVRGDVLELGCGEGHLAIELAKRGVHVKAIDISPERIARARARAATEFERRPGDAPEFIVADLNIITFPHAVYSAVVAHDALHHILNLDRLVGEVACALKENGRFIVYEFVGMGPFRKLAAAFSYAVLPTYRSYREKLKLSRRFGRFMKNEEGKRGELADAPATPESESPFEEISQSSIVPCIEKNFLIEERRDDHPFFFYLAPKMRFPNALKPILWRTLRSLDKTLLSLKLSRGAYVFINAVRRQ